MSRAVPIPNYVPIKPRPARVDVADRIRSFANLPRGWRYGEGGPISRRVINDALAWNRFLVSHGANDVEAAPSARGAISLAVTVNGRFTEVITEPQGRVTIYQDRRPESSVYLRSLPKEQAKSLLLGLMGVTCNMFAGFTQWIFIQTRGDLELRLSPIGPARTDAQDFRSFATTA